MRGPDIAKLEPNGEMKRVRTTVLRGSLLRGCQSLGRPRQKRILDDEITDVLAVLKIFGKQARATGLQCRCNDEGVVEAESVAGLDIYGLGV